MSFLGAIAKLRSALDIDQLPIPRAKVEMNALMGLDGLDLQGSPLPLPEQVGALLEVMGMGSSDAEKESEMSELDVSTPASS